MGRMTRSIARAGSRFRHSSAPVSFNALFARFAHSHTTYFFHRFIRHPAKEEGIGLGKALGRVTVHIFVRGYCTMIAASVQCDVDGIPKGSHDVLLKRANDQVQPRAGWSEWLGVS
jgi:hypothetical protein